MNLFENWSIEQLSEMIQTLGLYPNNRSILEDLHKKISEEIERKKKTELEKVLSQEDWILKQSIDGIKRCFPYQGIDSHETMNRVIKLVDYYKVKMKDLADERLRILNM
jgi:endonuclease III-like uncharacterized protein